MRKSPKPTIIATNRNAGTGRDSDAVHAVAVRSERHLPRTKQHRRMPMLGRLLWKSVRRLSARVRHEQRVPQSLGVPEQQVPGPVSGRVRSKCRLPRGESLAAVPLCGRIHRKPVERVPQRRANATE